MTGIDESVSGKRVIVATGNLTETETETGVNGRRSEIVIGVMTRTGRGSVRHPLQIRSRMSPLITGCLLVLTVSDTGHIRIHLRRMLVLGNVEGLLMTR